MTRPAHPPSVPRHERRSEPPVIVLTSGEPAGIGPDLCVMLAERTYDARIAVLGDPSVLAERAALLGSRVELQPLRHPAETPPHRPGVLCVVPVEAAAAVSPGTLDIANAGYVVEMLRKACDLCVSGEADALVTAPVQKSVIGRSGFTFSGHTEFLAERTGSATPVMLLAGDRVRVALVTTHLPLRAVPDAITVERIERVGTILRDGLVHAFGIPDPRILVLGLNPHAGEQATLGLEERDVIEPAIERLRARGCLASGPVAGDTAFTRESLARYDAVLAMYHDQGLGPLKALSFGEIVNVTLGLPIIRTSVDHGTALTLAGTGKARAESLAAALRLACELASRRRRPRPA